MQLRKITD